MNPDSYSFWGGAIESGETPEQAMRREIFEELGLALNLNHYRYLGTFPTPGAVKVVYYGKIERQFIDSLAIHEGQGGEWFDRYRIQNEIRMIPGDKKILEELLWTLGNETTDCFPAA